MGDESVVSGLSSIEPSAGGAPGGPAGAPSAEGIIKKMSTYWFIIGALPLIMFLLVAVPTVIYVKSVAGYVNAFYCSSKACDNFAELIKSTKGGKEPCTDFYAHVCDKVAADAKKTGRTGTRIFKVVTDAKYKPELPGSVLPDAVSLRGLWAQCHSLSSGQDAVGFARTLLKLPKWPFLMKTVPDPGPTLEEALAIAQKDFGVDVLIRTRLVHSSWTELGVAYQYNQPDTIEVEIGAPMMMEYDPLPLLVKEYKAPLRKMMTDFFGTTTDYNTGQNAQALSCVDVCDRLHTAVMTLRQTVLDDAMMVAPEVFTPAELDKLSPQTPKAPLIQLRYMEVLKKILPAKKMWDRVIVSQPKYLAELVKAINAIQLRDANLKKVCVVTYVGFMLLLHVFGPFLSRVYNKNLPPAVFEPLCRMHTDYMLPTLVSMTMVSSYNKRWVYGNAVEGKKVKPNQAIALMAGSVRDAILKAFALSTSSSDKSRINAYIKLRTMGILPAFYNTTAGIDNAVVDMILATLSQGSLGKDDFSADHLVQLRKNIMGLYWGVFTTKDYGKLLLREQLMATNLEGTYDYGSNAFYPSGGTFSPEHFKDSPVFMMNYARIGYYMSRGMLKAFDMRGGNVYPGVQLPGDWRGTLTAMKFKGVQTCLKKAVGQKADGKGMVYDIALDTLAVTPGFRFFREKALQKAAPKPEYRLAKFPDASSTELYFYAIATPMCEGLKKDKRLNNLVKFDRYFQEAFKCTSGPLRTGPDILYGKGADPGCYFWNTTRIDY